MPRPTARDRPALVDHVPALLDHIARRVAAADRGATPQPGRAPPPGHALARLEAGFDLREVIGELRVLRHCILTALADPTVAPVAVDELRVIDEAIDSAITDAVTRYTDARDRTLDGLDRIATAALDDGSLDERLHRLLQLLHDTSPAIDTSAILLRDHDRLRLRAAVGLAQGDNDDLSTAVGAGLAGSIAARDAPRARHDPTPVELHGAARAKLELRALYRVPIVDRGSVIGVAAIGSRTAEQLSRHDQRVVAAMVARASAAIVQHTLHDDGQRTLAQLADRERQLRVLADHIPQLAWMGDATGARYWYNQRWFDYTGTSLEAMQGSGWRAVHHPDHVERVVERWRHALAHGERWDDTFPLRGKDGFYRWFASSAVPIRDASGNIERWFGTHTDVTTRRFLDDATRVVNRSLDYHETLDELAKLVVPDLADWCVVDLVEAGELRHVAIAHVDHDKLEIARAFARTNPPDLNGANQVLSSGTAMLATEITDDMLAANARDPEHLLVLRALGFRSWIGAPLVARGTAIGVIHLIMSDSLRCYTEADLEVAAELGQRGGVAVDNARLYRDARDAIRVRDDVLAIVSHDLRNPLNAAHLGATMLLQRLGGDPQARKNLDVIRRATERMEHLINDLLDMACINAGKLAIEPAPVDARQLVGEVLDLHESLAGERGINLVREWNAGDASLHVDRNRIAQVFSNVLGNALKFCNPGDRITVRGARDGDKLCFEIADTGPGIDKADLPHIFEPYWSGRSGKKKGTGLGLFITRAIVEAHGGTITVDSAPGAGATFALTLPLAPPR